MNRFKSSGGTTNEVAEKQLQSLKKQSQLAFNELRIAGQILGKEFEPELRDALELIKSLQVFYRETFRFSKILNSFHEYNLRCI